MSKRRTFFKRLKKAVSYRWSSLHNFEDYAGFIAFLTIAMGIAGTGIAMVSGLAPLAVILTGVGVALVPLVITEAICLTVSYKRVQKYEALTGREDLDQSTEAALAPFYPWLYEVNHHHKDTAEGVRRAYDTFKEIVDHMQRNGEDAKNRIEVEAASETFKWISEASLALINLKKHRRVLVASKVNSDQAQAEKQRVYQRITQLEEEITENIETLEDLESEVRKLALLVPEFEDNLAPAPDSIKVALKETVALRETFESMDFPKNQAKLQ